MSENISGYDARTSSSRIYNRDAANEIGFRTTKLDLYESHALARFCEKLFNDGVERGRQSVAAHVRAVLPQFDVDAGRGKP